MWFAKLLGTHIPVFRATPPLFPTPRYKEKTFVVVDELRTEEQKMPNCC